MSSIDRHSGESAARAAFGIDGELACRGSWTRAWPPSLSISTIPAAPSVPAAAAGSADRDNRVRDHERSLVSGFLQSENAAREGEVAGIRGDAGRERAPETQ